MAVVLTATISSDVATKMASGSGGFQWSGSGVLTDVKIVASADTAVAVVIADASKNAFEIASSDFTTASGSANQNQKNESNSNFKSIAVQGQLTVTPTGIGSGNIIVTATVIEG